MAIETISILSLGFIAVAVASYLAGRWKWSAERQLLDADIRCLRADLAGQDLARKSQEKKYDQLYDSFLRLNQYNTELQKRLQAKSNTYEDLGDRIYLDLLAGVSRHDLAKKYNVNYSTLCFWIRKKKDEQLGEVKVESLF